MRQVEVKPYENGENHKLNLSKEGIFYTLQGEGRFIGYPSIFIRLQGCNLRCKWCDTKYTWDIKAGKSIPIEKIIEKINSYNCNHIVITGGEPLLQKNSLEKLIERLDYYTIEIETNGTIEPIKNTDIFYNVSPKLRNSGNNPELANKSEIIKKFLRYKSIFKFVFRDLKDIEEIEKEYGYIPKDRIMLMPLSLDLEAQTKILRKYWKVLLSKGYILTIRLQHMLSKKQWKI